MIHTLELVPVGNDLVSGGGDADVGDRENVLEEGKKLYLYKFLRIK